jgi:hypothetical protein
MKSVQIVRQILGLICLSFVISSCNVTKPVLGLSGGNYNSITDDMLLFNSSNAVIDELAGAVTGNNILIVQVVSAPNSDLLAEKIFEKLTQMGKTVGLAKRSEIGTMKTDQYEKLLFFYPTVYGIETAETRPSGLTKATMFIPLIGQVVGPSIIKMNTYDSRMSGVSIQARLVDSKTGKVEFMKVFNGKNNKKITGDSIFDITLP